MSLFFNSKKFYKPGPGVEKDEPQKIAPVRFFELLGRKFWKYVELNLVYFLILLPIILYIYTFIYQNSYFALEAAGVQIGDIYTLILHLAMLYFEYVPVFIQIILLIASIICYGPAKVGMTYVLRNFTNERHAWLSDMLDKAKENFRQGLFFGILDIIVFLVVFYNLAYAEGEGLLRIAKYLSILFFVFYGFMRRYIYQMIVTVNLSVFDIFKNAWLLAFIGIFRNVGVSIVNGLIWVGTIILIVTFSMLEIPILACLIYSFTSFLGVFATYPLIKKYLVDPILAQQQEEQQEEETPELVSDETHHFDENY